MARRAAASLITAILLWLPSTPAAAFTEGRMPLSKLAERAHTIVVGTVDDLESMERFFGDYIRIVTQATLGDLEIVKGDTANTEISVTQFGGQVGDVVEWYPGLPRFALDQRYLLFLVKADNGLSVPLGTQGFFIVAEVPESGSIVVLSATGQPVADIQNDGVVYGAMASKDDDTHSHLAGAMTLDLFLDRVRAVLHERP
jgi:hypothetical protein